jgi:hypothetical protein
MLSLSFSAGGPAPPSARAPTKVSNRAPKAPRVPLHHAYFVIPDAIAVVT